MDITAVEMHLPRKGSADVLVRREVRLPALAPGEARVAVEAAGVAYADIVIRQGLYSSAKPPITPGYDFVGRIEALGPGVSGFAVGQRVAAVTVTGSYASRRHIDARRLVPAPENADAALLVAAVLNGLTAWQMFHRIARPQPGEWVLVHGAAGGVGSLLLDLARLAGVRAIGTASAGKLGAVSARGAVALNHTAGDVQRRVREIAPEGVAAVFDHIGGKHFKTVSMPCVAAGGTGVLYGGYEATRGGRVHPLAVLDLLLNTGFSSLALFRRGQAVAGYSAPVWQTARPALYREDLARVLGLVAAGQLTPLVAGTYRLEDAARAQRALETRSVAGKIVLTPCAPAPTE